MKSDRHHHHYGYFAFAIAIAVLSVGMTGCGDASSEEASAHADVTPAVHKHDNSDETCFICDPALRDKGRLWCKEHGRYEDRCWLCHPELEDEDRLYCTEHFLYEDECHLCHPELKKQAKQAAKDTTAVARTASASTCAKHAVDESICFICDSSLRDKGRLWCKEHDRYEDRCWLCHPELEDKERAFCKEHSLYEDECFICNPALRKAAAAHSPARPSADAAPQGLFCHEHGVPEIECAICQPDLATSLKPGQSLKIRFASAQSTTKAGVRTAPAVVSSSTPKVSAYCEVRYNQNTLAQVTPLAPGVIRQVHVDVGAKVQAGDVLVELESPELARAKSDYLTKLQAVQLAEIDLKRSKTIHESTQKALEMLKGDVSVGVLEYMSDLKLGLNRRDLLTTHAQYMAAKAAYQREKDLMEQKIASAADFEAAEANYRKAWAEHLAIRDDIAFTSKRDLEAKERAHQAAVFALESAKRNLFTLGLSEAQVQNIPQEKSTELSRQNVRAPIAGTVVDRTAAIGEAMDAGNPLLTVADLSKMWLTLSIPADRAAMVKPGMKIEAHLPDLPGSMVEGELVWVDTSVNQRTRMISARAVVANPEGMLKAGMFGQANIVIGDAASAVRVPESAVQKHDKQPFVFVKLQDDLYALRRVTLGNEAGGAVDVLAGLEPEEPVVVAGAFTVMSEFLKSRLGAGCVH